jgi:hypothetical protein
VGATGINRFVGGGGQGTFILLPIIGTVDL